MEIVFKWLAANPYILLFAVIGGAVLLGKGTIKGYGLGMVASAIVVGAGISREAAKEVGSSVPWIGFPVGYAVSGVLLTVFGYVAMLMSK